MKTFAYILALTVPKVLGDACPSGYSKWKNGSTMCEKNLATPLWDFLWCPGGDLEDFESVSPMGFTQLACPGRACGSPDGEWCCPSSAKHKWQCKTRQLDLTENSCEASSGCNCIDDTAYITGFEFVSIPQVISEKSISTKTCCTQDESTCEIAKEWNLYDEISLSCDTTLFGQQLQFNGPIFSQGVL